MRYGINLANIWLAQDLLMIKILDSSMVLEGIFTSAHPEYQGIPMQQKPVSYGGIRNILLNTMIWVPILPFTLVLIISFYFFKTSLETNAQARMVRIVQDHRQLIENFLEERTRNLEFIINAYTFQELSESENLKAVFENLKKTSIAFVDLGVFNSDGLHVSYQGPYALEGRHYGDTDWFKEVMKSGYYISNVFMGYREVPHFIIAIASGAGSKRWAIRTTIDTQTFESLAGGVRIGDTGEAYIVNTSNELQTTRRSGGNLLEKIMDNIRYPASDRQIDSFIQQDDKGEKYLYATALLKNSTWVLVARQKTADAFALLTTTIYLAAVILFLGGAAIVAVAFHMTGRIVGRMEKLDAEKKDLSQQLIGTSRLAELGEMAAGFAHEINNPLQIIKNEQSLIDTLLSELKEAGQLKDSETLAELMDSVNQINLQISRCSKITQAILKFGRQSEPEVRDIDLKGFISEVTKMIQQKAGVHGIALHQNIAATKMIVRSDPAQLQQVLLNFFNNAIDAIIARHGVSGGELTVAARPTDQSFVEIRVTDNGSGISPENLEKVFMPFFTTKPVGQGTGLGLSVCYGIVESMGGSMEVNSQEGLGSTFTVKLPAAG